VCRSLVIFEPRMDEKIIRKETREK